SSRRESLSSRLLSHQGGEHQRAEDHADDGSAGGNGHGDNGVLLTLRLGDGPEDETGRAEDDRKEEEGERPQDDPCSAEAVPRAVRYREPVGRHDRPGWQN